MAEKKIFKLTAKILLGFLGLWALIIPILYIFGTTIYFPFKISGGGEIPYYRLQAVRLAVCLTFSYFAFAASNRKNPQIQNLDFSISIDPKRLEQGLYRCQALPTCVRSKQFPTFHFSMPEKKKTILFCITAYKCRQ